MDNFQKLCFQTRHDIITMLEKGQRGHILSALSIVEILNILYQDFLNISPTNQSNPSRDRFILSKGHGCMALYSVLARRGFFSTDHFDKFCLPDGMLGGHPERLKVPGVEASTGSLGHGLSIGIGIALHCKRMKYNNKIVVLLGDGECEEGSVWEAMLSASKNKLENLTILIDYNKQQSYGETRLEPFTQKWSSFGAHTVEVDMTKSPLLLKSAIEEEVMSPKVIICHTIKGYGIPSLEQNLHWHHKLRPSDDEIKKLRKELDEKSGIK